MLVITILQRRWVTVKKVIVYAAVLFALTISMWLIPSTKSQVEPQLTANRLGGRLPLQSPPSGTAEGGRLQQSSGKGVVS
jgi:hypothetical protein